MFVQECIDTSIPFLRITDKVDYALELMQEYKTAELAVVDNGIFLGMLSEKVLLECDDQLVVDALKENFLQHKIVEGSHLFDVQRLTAEFGVYNLAVVSAENEYLGITTPHKILQSLALHSSLAMSGGIIVLELATKDYSLTEISRIVESNSAVILHSMMATSVNQNFMQIALKINKNDLKDIQLAFERYKYNVVAVIHQSEYEVQLKERFDSLMRYLEV